MIAGRTATRCESDRTSVCHAKGTGGGWLNEKHRGTTWIAVLAACILCQTAAHGQATSSAVDIDYRNWITRASLEDGPDAAADLELRIGLTEADSADSRGRRSDTIHFLSYQFAAIGILYTLPEDVTGWTEEQKENYSLSTWWENVQDPTWDSDEFYLNYILHPYWGAAYFVRSRERGYGEYDSFLYAAALSAAYEFGAEALFEQPSIQDLIVTPIGGWFVGHYFMTVRDDILAGSEPGTDRPFGQDVVLALTDPLGALNRTVDGWFGMEQRFAIQPFMLTRDVPQRLQGGEIASETEWVYGLAFTYTW
jgi:hypothetical protein